MELAEKELKIKTPDKKFIYGTLGKAKKRANTLVVFVHGFTGNPNEHIFFNGSKLFAEKGLDTFRFHLYGAEKKNDRHFRETSISQHGSDITTVARFFRNKYKKIFVVGHSYGGTSLLFTDQNFIDGYVFWDASYVNSRNAMEYMRFNKKLNAYVLDWGVEYIVGRKFMKELKSFPDCGELIRKIKKPVLFITAGNKANSKDGPKYLKRANSPKKLLNIKTADHCFNNWKDEERLLNETYNWLK